MTDHSPPPFTPVEGEGKISDTKWQRNTCYDVNNETQYQKMGIIRTAKSLTMVNQKHGLIVQVVLDPSRTTSFEFCENGAKAVADEAMKNHWERL